MPPNADDPLRTTDHEPSTATTALMAAVGLTEAELREQWLDTPDGS
jgi:hypothetical protein